MDTKRGSRFWTAARYPGFRLLLTLGILFASAACPLPASANQDVVLEADRVRIDFADGREISEWQVQGPKTDPGKVWHSLATRGGPNGLISRHLSLEGDGQDREWSRQEASCLSSESRYLDGRLLVQRRLCESGTPFLLHLEIALKNASDRLLPDSDLAVRLGPGLGEYPISGLGIAESLYSYVQPVSFIDGQIQTASPEAGEEGRRIDLENKEFQWAGLQSRYLAMLLVPLEGSACRAVEYRWAGSSPKNRLPRRYLPETAIYLETAGLKPGQVRQNRFIVFSGPKSTAALKAGGHDFQRLLFSGQWQWMRMLSLALLSLLSWIQALVSNWGLSILGLALMVRIMIYPLARKMLADQQAFARVQGIIGPEIKEIKKHYCGEEQSERILGLYKKHGVSPFTGMKPLLIVLIQLPVFVALFHVLGQSVELQGASFLWIESLGLPDRLFSFGKDLPFFGAYFNLLPLLMAFSTLLTIKLSPSPGQNTLFLVIMALGFMLLFYPFPSGMVLYWTAANVLQIFQQTFMKKKALGQ